MTISIQTGITNNQYAYYRSKTNFKNPDNYVPERWLDDPDYVSDQKKSFPAVLLRCEELYWQKASDFQPRNSSSTIHA